MRALASHALRTTALLLSLAAAGCGPTDPDVLYFVEHRAGGLAWFESLPEPRQVDMFFASHRTRPGSGEVDLWILDHTPALLPKLRTALDTRGEEWDIDAFLFIVNAAARRNDIDATTVATLDIAPLCAKVHSQEPICRLPTAAPAP